MCALLGTSLAKTELACRLVKWEDTTPAASVAYAPSMDWLVGCQDLVLCSQNRQMRTIVSAIKKMFEASGPEKQELAFIHMTSWQNTSDEPGQCLLPSAVPGSSPAWEQVHVVADERDRKAMPAGISGHSLQLRDMVLQSVKGQHA